jgi:hypothetical protein
VFATSPTLVSPVLGTPLSANLQMQPDYLLLLEQQELYLLLEVALVLLKLVLETCTFYITNTSFSRSRNSITANLANATGLPIVAGTTGTLSVILVLLETLYFLHHQHL